MTLPFFQKPAFSYEKRPPSRKCDVMFFRSRGSGGYLASGGPFSQKWRPSRKSDVLFFKSHGFRWTSCLWRVVFLRNDVLLEKSVVCFFRSHSLRWASCLRRDIFLKQNDVLVDKDVSFSSKVVVRWASCLRRVASLKNHVLFETVTSCSSKVMVSGGHLASGGSFF